MSFGLTHRQKQALEFIAWYIAEHSVSPSFADIAANLKLANRSGVFRIVEALEARGHIRRMPNRGRSLEIVAPAPLPVRRPPVLVPRDSRLAAYCARTGRPVAAVIDECIERHMDVLELEEKVAALTKPSG
jgi:repressor LexA